MKINEPKYSDIYESTPGFVKIYFFEFLWLNLPLIIAIRNRNHGCNYIGVRIRSLINNSPLKINPIEVYFNHI